MSIWLLATAIPVTYIARTGSATVTAWLGSTQLPASIVAAQSEELGVDPAYWSNDFGKSTSSLLVVRFAAHATVPITESGTFSSSSSHPPVGSSWVCDRHDRRLLHCLARVRKCDRPAHWRRRCRWSRLALRQACRRGERERLIWFIMDMKGLLTRLNDF